MTLCSAVDSVLRCVPFASKPSSPISCVVAAAAPATPVMDVREEELQDLYMWVDGIPLSRPKKNIARDFSDGGEPISRVSQLDSLRRPPSHPGSQGEVCLKAVPLYTALKLLLTQMACSAPTVLMAEVVHHFFPRLVELHNYRCAPLACAYLAVM